MPRAAAVRRRDGPRQSFRSALRGSRRGPGALCAPRRAHCVADGTRESCRCGRYGGDEVLGVNAGEEASAVVARVLDPAKVTRTALQNAASATRIFDALADAGRKHRLARRSSCGRSCKSKRMRGKLQARPQTWAMPSSARLFSVHFFATLPQACEPAQAPHTGLYVVWRYTTRRRRRCDLDVIALQREQLTCRTCLAAPGRVWPHQPCLVLPGFALDRRRPRKLRA